MHCELQKAFFHKVKESQELSYKNTFLPMLFDLIGSYSHSYGVRNQHDEIIRLVLRQFFLSFLFEELTFMYICNSYLSPSFFFNIYLSEDRRRDFQYVDPSILLSSASVEEFKRGKASERERKEEAGVGVIIIVTSFIY